jgi:uncharacterized protein (DUF2336 family)
VDEETAMPVEFETLKQLAREPSPERRRQLLQAIANAFFAAPQRSATELNLFDEIMDKVLAEVEPLARRELAERLADLAEAPRRTLVRLAVDVIDVAEPVLTRSPALRDDDLAPIAREQSQDHLLAIARRKTLSSRLTDILVERGNDEVASTVTGNEGARFSEAGFEWLATRASANVAILNRLVMRSDLPERVANELLPVLASSIAEKIEATDEKGKVSTRKMIDDARLLLADRLRAAVSRARPLAVLNDQIARGNLTVAEAVAELADADQLVDLAAFVGTRIGVRSETVVRNLFLGGEETLMLVCRAAALNLDAFSAILRMRNRRRRGSAVEPARLMKDYLRIPRPMAENVMRTVREQEQAPDQHQVA